MFGNILEIHDFTIVVENKLKKVEASLVGCHVVFDGKYKIVAEVDSVTIDKIRFIMVGEFTEKGFISGIAHKPSSDSTIRVVSKEELVFLLGSQYVDTPTDIYIGKSLSYDGFNVSANINEFFSNHFAIIGNSGSGKSSSFARLIQNLFYRTRFVPNKSNIVLFDVYGEYYHALDRINYTKYCRSKVITTDINNTRAEIVKIPPYFLDADDFALLLNAESSSQLPLIEKALKYVYLFTEDESKVIAYKNNIIAKAVMDILSSGKNPAQIRDQVVAVLSSFNTVDINLNCRVYQPGYSRTFRQCINLDDTGKMNNIQLAIEYVEQYINDNLKLERYMRPSKFTLKDLHDAFEFALISEGVLKSDKVYDVNNILKVRLEDIINGDYGFYFEVDEYVDKSVYIDKLFINSKGEKAQIVNFNLNYVDERFAKVLTKIYSKMFYNHAVAKHKGTDYSIQIILEEAHRYVQNDSDINVIGYNIFDRITKEGRKYGAILGLITQRPSELSITALSQCSNYLILKMYYPDDLDIIKKISHNISESSIEKLKVSLPGVALCFGSAFKIPLFAKFDAPNPPPFSANAQIGNSWFTDSNEIVNTVVKSVDNRVNDTIEILQ